MLPYINQAFDYPARLTGASVDELKLIASFLLSYPLAGILKRIPDGQPWKKNAFIITVSLFYLVGLFDHWDGLRTLAYSSVGVYLIAYYVDGSLMPWIGFLFLMGHMSISHLSRQMVNDAGAVDITGAQMVMVMKLSSFCWNVHDGRLPREQLSNPQRYAAIAQFPGILDYVGYVFFFPSLFAGPSFEYVDYRRWIDTTLFDVPPGTDPSKAPPTRKKRRIPRSGRPAAKKAVLGLGWILLFLQLGSFYNKNTILSPDSQYMGYSFPRRVWILHMVGFTTRLKYYGVWSLTEGACILSGMGYNGFDANSGKVFWDRLENVNPWGLETAQNSHAYLGNWNKNTNHWLKNYMYLRVTPKGKKPGFRASLATFGTSALWHGFHPGYYLTFVLGSFIQTAAKNFRRHIRPFFLTPENKPTANKPYYDLASWLATQATLSFAVLPFIFLTFADCITVWQSVYFYGILTTLASLVVFATPAKSFLVKRLQDHAKKSPGMDKRPAPTRTDSGSTSAGGGQKDPTLALGLPDDPGKELEEAVQEIKAEIEKSRSGGGGGGGAVAMPSAEELKEKVEEKIGRKLA